MNKKIYDKNVKYILIICFLQVNLLCLFALNHSFKLYLSLTLGINIFGIIFWLLGFLSVYTIYGTNRNLVK